MTSPIYSFAMLVLLIWTTRAHTDWFVEAYVDKQTYAAVAHGAVALFAFACSLFHVVDLMFTLIGGTP